jgi:hypothetical protein
MKDGFEYKVPVLGFVVVKSHYHQSTGRGDESYVSIHPINFSCSDDASLSEKIELRAFDEIVGLLPAPANTYAICHFDKEGIEKIKRYDIDGITDICLFDELNKERKE